MIGWFGAPRIHLYAVCWNEERMLPFFFRHYEPWVQRFVIYDNDSTDGTLDLLRGKPNVDLRRFPWSHPDSFVLSQQSLQNACWKESRGQADWVIVTAIDEHLHHPRMTRYLRFCRWRGVTCMPALGYEMVSDDFPDAGLTLARHVTRGVPTDMMSKLRIFDPDAVESANLKVGGHGARPEGRIRYPKRDEMLLLHYKSLGLAYRHARNELLRGGLRERDRAENWGRHYSASQDEVAAQLDDLAQGAVDVADPAYVPWRDHRSPRWWR